MTELSISNQKPTIKSFYTITLYKFEVDKDKIIGGVDILDGMKSQPKSDSQNTNQQNFVNSDRLNSDPLESLYSLLNELAQDEASAVKATIFEENTDKNHLSTIEKDSIVKKKPAKTESLKDRSTQLKNLIEAEVIKEVSQAESAANLTSKVSEDKIKVTEPDRNQNVENKKTFSSDCNSIEEENTAISVSPDWIAEKERKINELAATLDSLIPLIVELSKTQADNSQEYILQAIVPIIDRVIQQRSTQDSQKMAAAIAHILPDAIRQEINNTPESIGKALAPEIAFSIKEQTLLNEGAIASAMGSEMGKAIKNQIEMERDAMVDALYPVIGSTISKYMNEVVQSINEKIDNALSPVGIRRKIRAKIQGVSEAELILQEALPSSIRAIFLIQNSSGLVIRELQPSKESPLESDLLAGMLTAIRSFAHDCMASNSELDEIDYDNFQILFETAGYCYLAVVVEGKPIRQFRDRMREIFSQIVMQYGNAIEQYQGDPDTVPQSIDLLLEKLVYESTKSDDRKPPRALYWSIIILLCGAIIPWGIIKYRGSVAHRIERAVAVELDANPELSVYRLTPEVKKGQLTITGRVPSDYLKGLAANVSNQIATAEDLSLNNQIVAVDVPPDPTVSAREVMQITEIINQNSQVAIDTDYQNGTVTINGSILDETARENLITNFQNIPGVENVVFVINQQLPTLETQIYFPSGTTQFTLAENLAKIAEIKQFLAQYPEIKLRIVGYSDRQGNAQTNRELAKARANSVYRALVERGITPNRLEVVASIEPPPQISPDQPLWLSRCVRFETFIIEKN